MNMEFKEWVRNRSQRTSNQREKRHTREDAHMEAMRTVSSRRGFYLWPNLECLIPTSESGAPLPMVYQTFLTNPNILGFCWLFLEILVVLLIIGKLFCPLTALQNWGPLTINLRQPQFIEYPPQPPFFLPLVFLLLSQSRKSNFYI